MKLGIVIVLFCRIVFAQQTLPFKSGEVVVDAPAKVSEKDTERNPLEKDYSLKILVTDIRSDEGSVVVSLHKNSKKFPSDSQAIIASESKKAQKGMIEITFAHIPAGDYAVAIHHDENNDGKMNYSFLGIPKEGFGFSNNRPVLFGPPSFESAQFSVLGPTSVTVRMKYF